MAGPLHPARLTALRSLFAARSAPFARSHLRSALARRSRCAAEAARVGSLARSFARPSYSVVKPLLGTHAGCRPFARAQGPAGQGTSFR